MQVLFSLDILLAVLLLYMMLVELLYYYVVCINVARKFHGIDF